MTGPSSDSLLAMPDASRFGLFSRSMNEIGMEFDCATGLHSVLVDLQLVGRRIFRLTNLYLSAASPSTEHELWDTLDAELKPTS